MQNSSILLRWVNLVELGGLGGLSRGWAVLGVVGLVVHVGTALLRVPLLWPYPKMVDFGAFYAAAAALRAGISPYPWPQDWASYLREFHGYTLQLVALNSFPVWPWLLQPLAALPFPWAAWVWFAVQLVLVWWTTRELARLANVEGRLARLVLYGLVLTFGPLTLNLTLGQTAVWVLVLALLLPRLCAEPGWQRGVCTGLLWLIALATKLYPALWVPGLAVLRCYPGLVGAVAAIAVAAFLQGFILPGITKHYLLEYLPARARHLTEAVLEDQSLGAFLVRLTHPLSFQVPGLWPWEKYPVVWNPPLAVSPWVAWAVAYGTLALLGGALLWQLNRRNEVPVAVRLQAWVLFSLTVLPHTERYNHALLLPAMALLWPRGSAAKRYVILAYFLTALSRLTHLWVLLFPWPVAALFTGSGLAAVGVLLVGLMKAYRRNNSAVQVGGAGANGSPIEDAPQSAEVSASLNGLFPKVPRNRGCWIFSAGIYGRLPTN